MVIALLRMVRCFAEARAPIRLPQQPESGKFGLRVALSSSATAWPCSLGKTGVSLLFNASRAYLLCFMHQI